MAVVLAELKSAQRANQEVSGKETPREILRRYFDTFREQGQKRGYSITAAFLRYVGDLIAEGKTGDSILKELQAASVITAGQPVIDYYVGTEVLFYRGLDFAEGSVPTLQLRKIISNLTIGTSWYAQVIPQTSPLTYDYTPSPGASDTQRDFAEKYRQGRLQIIPGNETGRFDRADTNIIWADTVMLGVPKDLFPSI